MIKKTLFQTLQVLTITVWLACIIFFIMVLNRLQFDYNEMGRYITNEGVVYEEQSILGYGVATFVFGVLGSILTFLWVKLKPRVHSS
jgi:hypothetical protein